MRPGIGTHSTTGPTSQFLLVLPGHGPVPQLGPNRTERPWVEAIMENKKGSPHSLRRVVVCATVQPMLNLWPLKYTLKGYDLRIIMLSQALNKYLGVDIIAL